MFLYHFTSHSFKKSPKRLILSNFCKSHFTLAKELLVSLIHIIFFLLASEAIKIFEDLVEKTKDDLEVSIFALSSLGIFLLKVDKAKAMYYFYLISYFIVKNWKIFKQRFNQLLVLNQKFIHNSIIST